MQYQKSTGIFSTQFAIVSFVVGTLFLIIDLINPSDEVLFLGYLYVIIAFFLNFIMLLNLVYLFISQNNHRAYYAVKILIILSNIPITAWYIYVVFNPNL